MTRKILQGVLMPDGTIIDGRQNTLPAFEARDGKWYFSRATPSDKGEPVHSQLYWHTDVIEENGKIEFPLSIRAEQEFKTYLATAAATSPSCETGFPQNDPQQQAIPCDVEHKP